MVFVCFLKGWKCSGNEATCVRAPVSTLSGDTSWCLNICAFSHVDQIYVHMKPVALLEPETIKIANTKEQSKNHPCENENWCYFASAKTNVPKHQDLVKLDTNAPFSDSFGHSFHCPNLWKWLLLWHVSRNVIIWHPTSDLQYPTFKLESVELFSSQPSYENRKSLQWSRITCGPA